MAANRGKSSKAHGANTHKRKMTRGTKIRKRVFGVTSLILAIVLANIPLGSQAALKPISDEPYLNYRLIEHPASLADTDGHIKLDENTPPANRDIWTYISLPTGSIDDTNAESDLNDYLRDLSNNGSSKTNYTAHRIYNLEYWSEDKRPSGSSAFELDSASWGTNNLYLGLDNLAQLMEIRDTYWTNSHLKLKDQYGADIKVFVYRKFEEDGSGKTPSGASAATKNGWTGAEPLHELSYIPAGNGYPGSIEGIQAGIKKDVDEDPYKITRIAIAYRDQMDVSGKTGSGTDPSLLMAACYYAADAKKGEHEIRFSEVDKANSGLEGSLNDDARLKTTDVYYEFNMKLMDVLIDKPADGGASRYAVSVPLPDSMKKTGTNNTGNYFLYRSKSKAQVASSAEAVAPFEVIQKDGKYLLQFTVTYSGTEKDYPNDFGLVFRDNGSGGTDDVKITVNTNPPGSGTVKIVREDTNAEVPNGGTVPKDTKVRLEATPVSPATFKNFTYLGSVVTNPITMDVNKTITANFETGGGGGGTPGNYVLTVKTNPTGLSASPTSGSRPEGDVQMTALDNAGYYFGYWEWDLGNDGVDDTVKDKQMIKYLGAHSTATAYYFTFKYLEGRGGLSVPISDISQDLAKLVNGTLNKNTTVRATSDPKGITKKDLGDKALALYPSTPIKVRSVDFFNLAMNPTDGVTGPYKITFEKFPLPASMDASTDTGGRIDLYYFDDKSDPMNPYLMPVPATIHNDGTITFTAEDTVVDMMGDYVLVQTTDPAFTVNDLRDNPTPSLSAGSATGEVVQGPLNGNRRLDIEDYAAGDPIYEDAKNNFADANGLGVDDYGYWTVIGSRLKGKDEGDPIETVKEDISRLSFSVPVDTIVHSEEVSIYQVTLSGGVYTYTPLTENIEFTKTIRNNDVMTIHFQNAQKNRYNADYLMLFTQTADFKVRDYRADKPADSDYITHISKQNPRTEDRYVTIQDIIPAEDAEITKAIKGRPGYENYEVIPYDIRYLDDPNPAIGKDMKDYSSVVLQLTVPTKAQGKKSLILVSLDTNQKPAKLILPESVTWDGPGKTVATFTATHFSPYAYAYLEDESVLNQVKVTAGTITPAGGGGFGGTGTYAKGDTVTLTAYPAAGHDIDHWETDDGKRVNVTGTDTDGNKTGTFTVTKDTVVNAFFTDVPKTHTVQAFPDPSGGGTVTIMTTPVGGPYDTGETVVIQATPAEGQKVDYWEDNGASVAGSSGKTTFTINSIDKNHTVIAHFIDKNATGTDITGGTPVVNVTPVIGGGGMGGTGGPGAGGTVTQTTDGSSVTLTAVPAAGFHFKEWQDAGGNTLSTANPYTFSPVGTINLRAVFEPDATTGGASGTVVNAGTGTTGGRVTVSQTTSGGKGSNSVDMPRTGLMDHYNVYKMLGVVILTMFGILELVSSMNTKRRRVAA